MKQILYFLLFFILILFFYSCDEDAANIDDRNGALKIIVTNNTEYDVKELYYKVGDTAPSYGNYGIKLNDGILSQGEKIEFCPNKEGKYYFTFVRQNGSNDTDLYVTSEYSLSLGLYSGIINLELLPFNFYYKPSKNLSNQCVIGD